MPLSFSTARTLKSPPDRVFAAMTDLEQARQWMQNIVALEKLTEGPIDVGSRWREVRKMFGKDAFEIFEVTTFEPPRRLGLYVDGKHGTTGRGAYRYNYLLEPEGNSTRLTMNGEIDMGGGWLTNLFCKLMGGTFKKMCEKDLDAMQRYVEDPSPQSVLSAS